MMIIIPARYTYTNDQRFRAIHKVKSEDYLLQVHCQQSVVYSTLNSALHRYCPPRGLTAACMNVRSVQLPS